MKRSLAVRLLQIFLVITGILLAVLWFFYTKDYSKHFRERKGSVASVSLHSKESSDPRRKSWLTLRSTSGMVVECGVLAPLDSSFRYPAIIVIGGKRTGKHAVDFAQNIPNLILVALDYPYEPKEGYTPLEFLSEVPEIRRALLDMVPSAMLVIDYLSRRADIDSSRIVLLGYSFGAQLVPAIMAHDKRPAVAAMVFGGGDIYSLIRHNVRRYEGPLTSECIAALGSLLLQPLEPLRYAREISPAPLLMINGLEDEQIPRESTERFYDEASKPKKIIWLESGHVNPVNVDLTHRIISTLIEELREKGIIRDSTVE